MLAEDVGIDSSGQVAPVSQQGDKQIQISKEDEAELAKTALDALIFINSEGFQYDLDNTIEGLERQMDEVDKWNDWFHGYKNDPYHDGSRWPRCQWHVKMDWETTPNRLIDPNAVYFGEVLRTNKNHSYIYKIAGRYPPVRYFSFQVCEWLSVLIVAQTAFIGMMEGFWGLPCMLSWMTDVWWC